VIDTEVRILRSSSTRAIVGMAASQHELAAATPRAAPKPFNRHVRAEV
jgi:hypothetical protein